jgi:hypothetical protein
MFSISESDVSAAWDAFERVQPHEVTGGFWQVFNNSEAATAEEQCWLGRTRYETILALEEPWRSKMARIVMGQQVEH